MDSDFLKFNHLLTERKKKYLIPKEIPGLWVVKLLNLHIFNPTALQTTAVISIWLYE